MKNPPFRDVQAQPDPPSELAADDARRRRLGRFRPEEVEVERLGDLEPDVQEGLHICRSAEDRGNVSWSAK